MQEHIKQTEPSRIYDTIESLLIFSRAELLELSNKNLTEINAIVAQIEKAENAVKTRNDCYDSNWYVRINGALRAKRAFQQRISSAISTIKERKKQENIKQRLEHGNKHIVECGYAIAFVEAAKIVIDKDTYMSIAETAQKILKKKP